MYNQSGGWEGGGGVRVRGDILVIHFLLVRVGK